MCENGITLCTVAIVTTLEHIAKTSAPKMLLRNLLNRYPVMHIFIKVRHLELLKIPLKFLKTRDFTLPCGVNLRISTAALSSV